ncbi:MAG: alpha/beta hydrolase [Propionibacterium sp.]|nr:alpha/beta hydrolase [Propionibacterium sp.]
MTTSERDERPPVNPLVSGILGLFAAPRINMREDYEKVRRAQRVLTWVPKDPDRIFDQVLASKAGHEITVRIVLPKSPTRDGVLVFFHGGGWTIGDIDTYTATCRTMADLTGMVVCSVDYRLAPEHPFPAGLEDCLEVTEAVLADVEDTDEVILIGDSAGGNLVAAVMLALREKGSALPGGQILLYPVTQWDHDPETSSFGSVRDYGTGLRLTSAEVNDFVEMYQPDPALRTSPYMSPLAADDLSGQPPALVMSAELDLLRDEGEAYGYALRNAGTPARVERVDGAIHGFITLPRVSRTLTSVYEVINAFLDGDMQDSRPLGPPAVVDAVGRG